MGSAEDTSQPGLPGAAAPSAGIREPEHPGPFAVGRYANELRAFLRKRPRVRLLGEVTGLRMTGKSAYFELRDAEGALPCSMWRTDLDRMGLAEGVLCDGCEVVVAGGLDYYAGSATASPSFTFRATHLRPAGEGDLLAQLARLRKRLQADGLFEPQKELPMPILPRAIGVVTGRDSAALADVRAALGRRGWGGRVVLAHPPVQDRHAAPRIRDALQGLAAIEEVEVIVVARGGGSLTDLWAFCDEQLCRTVALLRVPVVSAIGHEVDRTLLDDVAAVCCSTPTHAVEAAVQVEIGAERARLAGAAARLAATRSRAIADRAPTLRSRALALTRYAGAERDRLHQTIREIRAASARACRERRAGAARFALVLSRKSVATRGEIGRRRRPALAASASSLRRRSEASARDRLRELDRLAATLEAHAPDRVLERGYALATDRGDGRPVTSAAAAREAGELRLRFRDDRVDVEVSDG